MKDDDVREISESFDPLENLNLYTNPELVESYFRGLKSGLFIRKDDPFTPFETSQDGQRTKTGDIFPILFAIDDWDLFYKTCVYALARMNMESFFLALKVILSSKYAHENFQTPPTYEVLPQMYAPKRLIYSYNGLEGLQTDLTNGEEAKLNYFRDSPSLNEFHLAWHNNFPLWGKYPSDKFRKDRKGELFLYMHRQLVNRYRAERLSVGGLGDVLPLNLDEEIATGYVADVLDGSFREFPIRYNNTRLQDDPNLTVEQTASLVSTLRDAISKGILLNDNGTEISLRHNGGYDIVGATVEGTADAASTLNHKTLHYNIHELICVVRDLMGTLQLPPGIVFTSFTSLRDPVFFSIHTLVDEFYTLQSQNLKQYNEDDLRLDGVDLISVRITREGKKMPLHNGETQTTSVLETFYEDFSFDISNGIKFCDKPPRAKEATARILRHNHKPFQYSLQVLSSNKGEINATIRIYMSPTIGYNGEVYSDDELYANMFEMDRFHVTLSTGENIILRSSKDSAVTVPDATPLKQLLKETEEAVKAGTKRPEDESHRSYRHCGFPQHLLVPKGTPEGQTFKMFVIVTKDQQLGQQSYPGLALCGVPTGLFPDKEIMGFPFDRKINFKLNHSTLSPPQTYKFLDIIVRLNEGYIL